MPLNFTTKSNSLKENTKRNLIRKKNKHKNREDKSLLYK